MMNIGSQIKKIRKLKKISLTELAQTSGVQIATLSRIENGKMTGTLESHFQISKALGLEITELYQGIQEEESLPVSADDAIEVVSAPNDTVSREILTRQASSKRMLPVLVKIAPKSSGNIEKNSPGSERFIFVLDGSVLVHIKDQAVRVNTNTSLYFNASLPHHFENPLAAPVKFILITTPVAL